MTRKELLEAEEWYKVQIVNARARLEKDDLYMEILHQCFLLGSRLDCNHHERRQRLWAYIQALRGLGIVPITSKKKYLWEHTGGIPYEGEIWECTNCGFEIIVPEDRDLPETCPECGNGGE